MNTSKIFKGLSIAFCALTMMTSCGDAFLTTESTEKPEAGAPATEGAILSALTATYQILLFDTYAANNYNAILLMSDLRSDDLYKGGGDAGDQSALYSLSQFNVAPSESLIGLWSIYYSGIARANNAIISCENAVSVPAAKLTQYTAEAYFLRAYYTHLLWKLFGDIPYFTRPLQEPYLAKQYTSDEIYTFIMDDLEVACQEGAMLMNTNSGSTIGRASRAAALMLKSRVVMYQQDTDRYAEVAADLACIINSGEFELYSDFDALWEDTQEFCEESIFEANHIPDGKVWPNGWQGYGTNLPAFISPSELKDPEKVFKGGWGFAPVRLEVLDIFENGDTRLAGSINDWREGEYARRFQDTGLFQRKYAAREGYNPPPGDQDLNYTNNLRIFRYAETLLSYAELVSMHGVAEQGASAQAAFDAVRERAFGESKPIALTAENIKLERRREFVGEGMRFYDLVRWGDAESVLTESNPAFHSSRTFTANKRYIPIPQSEIDKTKGTKYPLEQRYY